MSIAAIAALTILAVLSIFQVALALGAPLGHFAWGGQHKQLPKNLRVGSALSPVVYAVFAAFIASKVGIWVLITDAITLNVGLWIIFAYFIIGIFMNGISRSKLERYIMTPVCLVLAVCFLFIAKS